jgi:hypothetical protein
MHWLIFNFVTVMLTALILPSIIRYIILKRPLNKIASIVKCAFIDAHSDEGINLLARQ